MTHEEAYQMALKIALAARSGKPMPDVPPEREKVAKALWLSIRKRHYIK